jgi:hypothetical protein
MHENRETSQASARATAADRRAKGNRTARMHAGKESDCGVVPMNHPNKDRQLLAEGEEGRLRTKENVSWSYTSPTQSGKSVSQGLAGVRRVAVRFAAKHPR